MTRIEETFASLKERNEAALVAFVTWGDPDSRQSAEVLAALAEGGADIIELGIPFSDPTADGPVIQRSSTRALASGSDLAGALAAVSEFRRRFAVPVILFTYYNPIFIYGVGRLVKDALAAGADGALVVDLPPEESGDISDAVRNKDFHLIRLVAPTTTAERMETIARGASGFLYLVSMTGVTGTRALEPAEVTDYLAQLRRVSALPLCVGFGINRPDQVRALSSVADGIVVGSAFERIIEERLGRNDIADGVRTFTRSLKDATRR